MHCRLLGEDWLVTLFAEMKPIPVKIDIWVALSQEGDCPVQQNLVLVIG